MAPILQSAFSWSRPAYQLVMSGACGKLLPDVLKLIEAGKMQVVLDTKGPFSFTAEGVRNAFLLQSSGRAHGKVVVLLQANPQSSIAPELK